jgi:hypothetical protein
MDTPNWPKVRVWWVARHRGSGTSHLAASGFGNYKITRCGLRLRGESRDWRMFAWERVGRVPPTPTCAQCLRFLKVPAARD